MKPTVAFICVHNSCRSQMAEAIAKGIADDTFIAYSAGTEVKPEINQDAVRLIKQKYNIDMNETQHSKLISDIPDVDIVITMGCNVECPTLPSKYREDWGLDDPSGLSDSEFELCIKNIELKMQSLIERVKSKELY